MCKSDLVTIITPCYNGESFLDNYFCSLLAQSYRNIEIIFVNDGSTDETQNIVYKYKKQFEDKGIVFKYIYQNNGGQAKAINNALQYIEGEYMIWPDSDDLLSSDSIEKRVMFLKNNPQYSFVRSNGYFFDFETKDYLYRISNMENRYDEDIFLDLILEKTYCFCGCYMIKTNILKEFYPDFKIYESSEGQNWQILIPIASKYKCGFIDEDLYMIAVRKDSHSRRKRTVEESVHRLNGLRDILENTISISKREDMDFKYILDVKYRKLRMKLYLDNNNLDMAKIEYNWLKKIKEINYDDYQMYISKTSPVKFKIMRIINLVKRIINKLRRCMFS